MIRCIVSDMDGTLLNEMGKISKANIEAIKDARANGIDFVIATGRAYIEAKHLLEEAGLTCPVLSINGAAVWNEKGDLVHSVPMDTRELKKVRAILDREGILYEVFTNKGSYVKDIDVAIAAVVDIFMTAMPGLDPLLVTEKARERYVDGYIHEVEDFDLLDREEDLEIYKVLAFSTDLPLLGKLGGELKEATDLTVTSSGKENLEITSLDAQKGIAVEAYVAKRNIALSETMALGDNFNDVSMFERVGRPVAMGNAPAEIKDLCGEVTLSNMEDGVAAAIRKAIEQNKMETE